MAIVTRQIVFGMNALTLIGFVVMGIGLNLGRSRRVRPALAVALMAAGTALVFAGVWALPPKT